MNYYEIGKPYLLHINTDTEHIYTRVTDASEAREIYCDHIHGGTFVVILIGFLEEETQVYIDGYGNKDIVRYTFAFLLVGSEKIQKVVYTFYKEHKDKIIRIIEKYES